MLPGVDTVDQTGAPAIEMRGDRADDEIGGTTRRRYIGALADHADDVAVEAIDTAGPIAAQSAIGAIAMLRPRRSQRGGGALGPIILGPSPAAGMRWHVTARRRTNRDQLSIV